MKSEAIYLPQPQGDPEIREMEVPALGAGEVQVRMQACGICHSDVMIAGLPKLPRAPLILGHEGIGVVEDIGDGVSNVTKGDRVGVTYLASACGACDLCRSGHERFCAKQQNHGYTRDGVLARTANVAAHNLVRVPASLSAAEAAPLCCAGWTAYGALREAGLERDQLLAIFGFGGLGHIALRYARHAGLRVAVVDVSEAKLEFARRLGADIVTTLENARRILGKEHGGVDGAVVLTAAAEAVPVAVACLKRCGTAVLVGLTADKYAIPVNEAVLKGLRIQGSFLGTRADLESVFALAEQGIGKPEVTEHALADAPELIARLRSGGVTGRAVVVF